MTILELTISLVLASGVAYTTLELTELVEQKIHVYQDIQKQMLAPYATNTKDENGNLNR